MGKILPFIYKGIDVTQLELVDDYYIMLDELSELSERSMKRILKDIDKGILKADKINGDLLVPMDMAQKYINKSLDIKMMLSAIFMSLVITIGFVLGISLHIIAGKM